MLYSASNYISVYLYLSGAGRGLASLLHVDSPVGPALSCRPCSDASHDRLAQSTYWLVDLDSPVSAGRHDGRQPLLDCSGCRLRGGLSSESCPPDPLPCVGSGQRFSRLGLRAQDRAHRHYAGLWPLRNRCVQRGHGRFLALRDGCVHCWFCAGAHGRDAPAPQLRGVGAEATARGGEQEAAGGAQRAATGKRYRREMESRWKEGPSEC